MNFESQNLKKYVGPTICHEWGHVLISYLLYGTLKNVTHIDFEDNIYGVFGHTNRLDYYVMVDGEQPSMFYIDKDTDKEIMFLLAGVMATKVCGYNKGRFRSDATDKVKIEELTKNKKRISELRRKTEEMLSPLKGTLDALINRTLADYPKSRDNNQEKYYQIDNLEIIEWVSTYLPKPLHPTKVYSIKKNLDDVI